MIRSSGTDSDAAGSVMADSSHPCQASFHPRSHDNRLRELPLLKDLSGRGDLHFHRTLGKAPNCLLHLVKR